MGMRRRRGKRARRERREGRRGHCTRARGAGRGRHGGEEARPQSTWQYSTSEAAVVLGGVVYPLLCAREAAYDVVAEQVATSLWWWQEGWHGTAYGR